MRVPRGLAISVHLPAWDLGYRLNRMEARATREALTAEEIEHLAEALGVKPWARWTDSEASR